MSCFSVSLRSGSSGNSTFIRTESARLIVDLGLNGKRFAMALEEFDEDPNQIDAVLLTHEHIDHVSGVGVVMRRHKIPLYTTLSTFNKAEALLGKIDYDLVHLIVPGNPFTVRDTEILAFPTSHDAVDPVGFRISSRYGDVGVMTDTGEFDQYAREGLKGCKAVYLESNYDDDMLWNGDYPYPLKVRIDSRSGHLSNFEAGQVACYLLENGVEALALSHLSQENNLPELALETVSEALQEAGAKIDLDVRVRVSERYHCSVPFILE